MAELRRILILCTGNSCRSQMAEGWVNHLLGGRFEAHSAGTRPAERVNPLAVRAMAEVGIDISGGRPESVDAFVDQPWHLVITVCDSARQACPVFPGQAKTLHISFPDPARAVGDEDQRMAVYRSVRDDIRERLVPALEVRAANNGSTIGA